MTTPLDANQLEDLLENILWAEASSKRSSAESLARLDRPQQDFVLHWVRALETLRLDARIARELPGVHRDMLHLNAITGRRASPPEHVKQLISSIMLDLGELPYKVSEIYRRLTL